MSNKTWLALWAAALLGSTVYAKADEYPDKPIKIVVPYAAGGTTDLMARTVAERLQEKWGQPVIVDNRGGAGGNLGAEAVWRSPPDGYTLLFSAAGPLTINSLLYNKLAYDPATFVPVSVVSTSYSALVVNPGLAAKNVAQLIAFAKANPGKLNYGSSGTGSTPHLAAESFKAMAGIDIAHVPYRGAGPALTDLVAGHVQMMFAELSLALPQIRAGKVRLLAISSAQRRPSIPDIPTVAETLPGFLSVTWFALAAPPNTPPALGNKLSAAVAEALARPDIRKRFSEFNIEAVGGTAAEMAQLQKQEGERWGKVIRSSGMTAD